MTPLLLLAVWVTPSFQAGTNMFPDVPKGHWAYEAVKDLKQRGILEGYPAGKFQGKQALPCAKAPHDPRQTNRITLRAIPRHKRTSRPAVDAPKTLQR